MDSNAAENPGDVAELADAADRPWQPLAGVTPQTADYPARAKLDGEGIVIFKTDAGWRGVQRNCPHMQATMLHGELAGNGTMVRCSLHMFTFKLADGKGVNCPGFKVSVYEIKEDNGQLFGRQAN
jgi:nitrite reductase/ring-hydroxylating ferredoxin subunit